MTSRTSTSVAFRRTLRDELVHWRAHGVIDAHQAEALSQLYRLDTLGEPARLSLPGAMFGFGVLLVGLGVISFVAANWQAIPALAKALLLLSAMWSAYAGGFWFYRRRSGLAQGLLLLGSLIWGANIGLFGQIFHLQGQVHEALLLWSAGTLLVFFVLPGWPQALLALATWMASWWNWSFTSSPPPLLAGWLCLVLFGLAAWRVRSYRLTQLVLVAGCATIYARDFLRLNEQPELLVLLTLLFAAGLWSLTTVPALLTDDGAAGRLGRGLATLTFMGFCWLYSFWDVFQRDRDWWSAIAQPELCGWLLVAGAAAGWLAQRRLPRPLLYGAAVCGVAALGTLGPLFLALPQSVTFIWSNLAGLAAGSLWVRLGLLANDRNAFLLGCGWWGLLILSRFFEFDTGLLLKSLAFIGVGLAVIAAALWFEKRRPEELHHA